MFKNEITKKQNEKRIIFVRIFDIVLMILWAGLSIAYFNEYGLWHLQTILGVVATLTFMWFVAQDFS